MRIYTNPALDTLWSYAKLMIAAVALFTLLSFAFKTWQNEPALQELMNLLNSAKSEQNQPQ